MKRLLIKPVGVLLSLIALKAVATDHYVDLNCANPVAPYTDWSTAATNIQDAIDAALAGEVVWVTNGVYATGGKVESTTLTNRVALDKALTVQSVNGPFVTTVAGLGAGTGNQAIRCAWLTNGAILRGFTIQGGGTRGITGSSVEQNGAGVWCASTNALVASCVIRSNVANQLGGGSYQGTLKNCLLVANLAGNPQGGGGAYGAALNNCTVISNSNAGVYNSTLTNCIVYFNPFGGNYGGSTLSFCCSTPLPGGAGNMTNSPQLFPDGLHLVNTSPCRGSGTNTGGGTDIFGNLWGDPPSMGCAEWQAAPFPSSPNFQFTSDPVGFKIALTVAGQQPFGCWWFRDGVPIQDDGHYSGTQTTNLLANWVRSSDAGVYQLVVSNSSGMATSSVVSVVIHCVDAAGTNPVPPYLSWSTAATNIQAGIDASAVGEVVLVTNGVYSTGGKVATGDLTNRVMLDKALLVGSVNGSAATIIQGVWDALTNGPASVRCAWLTTNAILAGFTLRQGSTRSLTAAFDMQQCGGGALGHSNSVVAASSLMNNAAALYGGGAYAYPGGAFGLILKNCSLLGNLNLGVRGYGAGGLGGGAYGCSLTNCLVSGNFALQSGGGVYLGGYCQNCAIIGNSAAASTGGAGSGAYGGTLNNCTVARNTLTSPIYTGSGVYNATLNNCIVFGNSSRAGVDNYGGICNFSFSCSTPLPSGTGNIGVDPQLLSDGYHLPANSPCRGAGTSGLVKGTDIDGQPWANPPSMGCDEWQPAPALGGQLQATPGGIPLALKLSGLSLAGQDPFTITWLRDASSLSGSRYLMGSPDLIVQGFGPDDAGSYLVVVSNAFGMCTSAPVQVTVHCANATDGSPVSPFSTWLTAATNLQDAIDVTGSGEFVLATNGIYSTGGRVMAGDLTNRIAVSNAISVFSLNGPTKTIIQGLWDKTATNGPGAVRCAWLADGATLEGFTLRNGATRNTGDFFLLERGGGVWCTSTNASLINCMFSNNAAYYAGGGAYQGLLRNCWLGNNVSMTYGGGANNSFLVNSTLTGNSAPFSSGGGYSYDQSGSMKLLNSIVYGNYVLGQPAIQNEWNISGSPAFYNCCSFYQSGPLPGTNNTTAYPELLDGIHITATSPCRGTGNVAYVSGNDIDGEPWTNPPSMGCDEYWEGGITGPLTVGLALGYPGRAIQGNHSFVVATVSGRVTRTAWAFGDGSVLTNASSFGPPHTWTNAGNFVLTFTAFNADHPAGVSTNLSIYVYPAGPPSVSSGGMTSSGFALNIPTTNGVTYYVLGTTNLAVPFWQTLGTFTGYGSNQQFIDTPLTNAQRFYRVKILQ